MKRILRGAVAAVLLVAISGAAYAETGKGVEAGFQMWINDWTHDVPRAGSVTSDTTVLFGPAIKVELPHHFFVDASYLFSLSDYTFTNDTVYNDERQDATMTVGYMIVPEFGVLAGNKISWFKEKETGFKDTVYGPLIGMIGIAPIYYNTAFYGKLDYLFTKFRQRGGGFADFKEDSPGWDLEFGFKIDFTREFSGTFGYRYETNTGSDSDIQDSFSGLIFSGMFHF
jgi:hypothetical protein